MTDRVTPEQMRSAADMMDEVAESARKADARHIASGSEGSPNEPLISQIEEQASNWRRRADEYESE